MPAVIASYVKSLADSGNDARIAAIAYLAAAWKTDSAAFAPALRQQITRSQAVRRSTRAGRGRKRFDLCIMVIGVETSRGRWRGTRIIVRAYVVPALRGNTQRATIRTRRGDIVLELFGADAPITVWNFMNLARTGYYKGTGFHRVVPNFVAQDGDPRDDGTAAPDTPFAMR